MTWMDLSVKAGYDTLTWLWHGWTFLSKPGLTHWHGYDMDGPFCQSLPWHIDLAMTWIDISVKAGCDTLTLLWHGWTFLSKLAVTHWHSYDMDGPFCQSWLWHIDTAMTWMDLSVKAGCDTLTRLWHGWTFLSKLALTHWHGYDIDDLFCPSLLWHIDTAIDRPMTWMNIFPELISLSFSFLENFKVLKINGGKKNFTSISVTLCWG